VLKSKHIKQERLNKKFMDKKTHTITREVWSSNDFMTFTSKITFKKVDDVKELISLIKNFKALNEVASNKLSSYKVRNTFADVKIWSGDDEQVCDVDMVEVTEHTISFHLMSKYATDIFRVHELYVDDLNTIIKYVEA